MGARELHNDGAQGSLESARQSAESALEDYRYQKTDEPPSEEVGAVPARGRKRTLEGVRQRRYHPASWCAHKNHTSL